MDDLAERADRLRELERQRGERPDDVEVRDDGAASVYVVAADPPIVTDCCIDDIREVR